MAPGFLRIFFLFVAAISICFEAQAAPFRTQFRGMTSATHNPQDLIDLQAFGANLVEFHLVYPGPVDDASLLEYSNWLDSELLIIDQLLTTCQQVGMKMLINVHTPPGGYEVRNGSRFQHRLFIDTAARDALIATWVKIATRYKGNSAVYGYELLNEPFQRDVVSGIGTWNDLSATIVAAIRAVDSSTLIVIEPLFGNPVYFSKLTAITDGTVAYAFHAYYNSSFRAQGLGGRPINIVYPKKRFNRANLIKSMARAVGFARKNKVKMICGEFSAPRWAPKGSGFRYLRDHIQFFEKNGWDWAYHVWRSSDIWSVEQGNKFNDSSYVDPRTTDRGKLLFKYYKRNAAP